MKKLLLFLVLASFSISSYAETLVYAGFIRYDGFVMKNSGNVRESGFTRAYLIVAYDTTTRIFSTPTIIKYWKENEQNVYLETPYTGSLTQNAILNPPPGNRVFMKGFTGDNIFKSYEFLDGSKMIKGYPSWLIFGYGVSIPVSNSLEGSQIAEDVGDLGYRKIRSSRVKFVIAQKWTKDNMINDVPTTVGNIIAWFALPQNGGYLPYVPYSPVP